MEFFVTPGLQLTERLDPTHYRPTLIAAEGQVRSLGAATLSSWVKRSGIGHTAAVTPHYTDSSEGVPFISGAAIQDGTIVTYDVEHVLPTSHHGVMGSSRLKPGMLVAVRKGELGNSAVVCSTIKELNCSSEVIYFELHEPGEAGFLQSFFNSRFGRDAFKRQQRGMMIPGISLLDVPDIVIPKPRREARLYIASKALQAEALRQRAQVDERTFAAAVAISVPPADERSRYSRVAATCLVGDLNAGCFTPDRQAVRAALGARPEARRIGAFCQIVAETTQSFRPHSAYLGLDGISSHSIDVTLSTIAVAGVTGTGRKMHPGAVISKLRPYLNKTTYIPDTMAHVVGSTELLCVVPNNGVHPAFVYGLLKLDTTVRQLNPVATGATHPRVDSDDVLDVLVPWHVDHERLARSLVVAQDRYRAARSLVAAARVLVEALIERKVTEAELVAAAADPAADRALLARLTSAGIDAAGEPLFPDLDALEALLKPGEP